MSKPMVSVVIPTYKRPALLDAAIGSVLAQTYEDWELVVVDDNDEASPYRRETEAFMARYADNPKIRYLKHHKNAGNCAARNTGIRAASGELVAFLDDDDAWLPEKLERQVALFEDASDTLGLVYTGLRIVEGDTVRVRMPKPKRSDLEDLFIDNYVVTTSAIMCRRAALEHVGMFDESLPSAGEDWDLYVRLAQSYAFGHVAQVLTIYHKHEGESMIKNHTNYVRSYDALYSKHNGLLKRNRRLHALFLKKQGRLLQAAGDPRRAARKFLRSLLMAPGDRQTLKLLLQARLGEGGYDSILSSTRPLRKLLRRPGHG